MTFAIQLRTLREPLECYKEVVVSPEATCQVFFGMAWSSIDQCCRSTIAIKASPFFHFWSIRTSYLSPRRQQSFWILDGTVCHGIFIRRLTPASKENKRPGMSRIKLRRLPWELDDPSGVIPAGVRRSEIPVEETNAMEWPRSWLLFLSAEMTSGRWSPLKWLFHGIRADFNPRLPGAKTLYPLYLSARIACVRTWKALALPQSLGRWCGDLVKGHRSVWLIKPNLIWPLLGSFGWVRDV